MSGPGTSRQLAPGVFWLADCHEQRYQGRILHNYASSFLVSGEDASLLVEAGHPWDLTIVEPMLASLLAGGLAPLRYIFTTHQETPHAGGLGRLLDLYPDAVSSGDARDLALIFPSFEGRFHPLAVGDAIDLGGREFVAVEPVIIDLTSTLWGFDTGARVLFPGDGFAFAHYHETNHCGKLVEEVESLDIPAMAGLFAELALHWTRFSDLDPYIDRLNELVFDELGATLIAPTHGLPITDPVKAMPAIAAGLRLGSGADHG